MKKNLLRGLVVIIVAAGILLMLNKILLLKSEDGISQLNALYKQNDNTIDALFLGSSHVYCDISTGVLWDDYGIAGFDLGGAEAPSFTSYYHLKEALKTQHPQVIFYEISIAALRPTLNPPEFWVEDNNYGMKWNSNRIDMLRANTLEETFPKILFPLSAMHGRYTDLGENDFTDVRNSINYKGFDPREYVTPFETPDISGVTGYTPCSEKAEEYLRKIIALTKEENIPLVLFVSPYVVNESEQEMYNYMFGIGEAEGVDIIDFNKRYEEMGMDFATDMAEELHLNYSGNYKFSKYLGSILRDEYNIPDRRGNAAYSSWEVDAARQRIERTDLQLLITKDANEFIDLSANTGYVSFVAFSRDASEIEADTKENLVKLGIPEDKMLADTAYIVKNGTIVKSLDGHFRADIKEGNDKLLFLSEGDDEARMVTLYVNEKENSYEYCSIIYTYDTLLNQYVGAKRF